MARELCPGLPTCGADRLSRPCVPGPHGEAHPLCRSEYAHGAELCRGTTACRHGARARAPLPGATWHERADLHPAGRPISGACKDRLEQPAVATAGRDVYGRSARAPTWRKPVRTNGALPGTVIAVSHDRAFLRSFAERVIEVRDGRVRLFPDGYHPTPGGMVWPTTAL